MKFLCAALVLAAVVAGASACQPPDCDNVDYGTCGNACCNITVSLPMSAVDTKNLLMNTLSSGGPDGRYKLSMTAEGTLGFADLRPYHIGISFLGQAVHHTKVHHYNDTINLGLYPQGASSTLVTAFSISGIAGAYGDAGQNFKNLIQIFKAPGFPALDYKIIAGCPPKAGAAPVEHTPKPVVDVEPEPENLHASCRLTWTFPNIECSAASAGLASAARDMQGFSSCDSSEKCGYTVISANSTELIAYHETPVHKYRDDISISFQNSGGDCVAHGYSTSTIWYAVLDDGTNYCNLHNLAEASGLSFSEDVDRSDCTQYSSANCNKY